VRKKVLFCDAFGVHDNVTCASKAQRIAVTEAACAAAGYPAPAGYHWSGRAYANHVLRSPHVTLPPNPCPRGTRRYWRYSCCQYRHCGDAGDRPDGEVSISDIQRIGQAADGTAPITSRQQRKAADLDLDGALTVADVQIAADYWSSIGDPAGLKGLPCAVDGSHRCTIPCGDGDGNGILVRGNQVNPDRDAMNDYIAGNAIPSRCQFWAADVNGDGLLTADDVDAVKGNGPLTGCAPQ
jgi:hypothetical protein